MKEPKKITLYHPVNDPVTLDEEHALRVLAMENNGGWYTKEKEAKKDDATGGKEEGRKSQG